MKERIVRAHHRRCVELWVGQKGERMGVGRRQNFLERCRRNKMYGRKGGRRKQWKREGRSRHGHTMGIGYDDELGCNVQRQAGRDVKEGT